MSPRSYLDRSFLKRWSVTLFFLTLFGLGAPPLIKGQLESMNSDSYIIQLGNFNTTSGEKSGGGYNVTDTVGQIAPGEYNSAGYKVFAGFQYVYAIPQFSFRITNLSMPLGELSTDQFAENSHELVVTTRSGGYSILTQAQHKLRRAGGPSASSIAHTNCNSGCTISSANTWTDPSKAGFGYNASGTHVTSDFINNSYFRPFADLENAEVAQEIASHNSVVRDDVITISYRASILGSQAAGNYSTTIDYLAIPTY